MTTRYWLAGLAIATLIIGFISIALFCPTPALAQEEAAVAAVEEAPAEEESAPITAESVKFMVDNLWIMLAGALVFIMHLGFATLHHLHRNALSFRINAVFNQLFDHARRPFHHFTRCYLVSQTG